MGWCAKDCAGFVLIQKSESGWFSVLHRQAGFETNEWISSGRALQNHRSL